MYELKSDIDQPLVLFLNDYAEGLLDPSEQSAFEACMAADSELHFLATKSKAGKRALTNAYRVEAADDFEEKLQRRIAGEKKKSSKKSHAPS